MLREIKTNKTLQFWIGSYLAIVLVSIIVNMAGHFAILQITNAEKRRNISDMTAQMRFVYDSYFQSMETSAHNLLESYAVKNLISVPGDNENKDEWIKTIMRDVTLQESSMDITKNIILIFNNEDICIVNNAMYTKDVAYEVLFQPYYSTKEAWLSDMFSVLHKEYKSVVNAEGEQKNFFIYAYSALNQEPPLIMVAEVNGEVLRGALDRTELTDVSRMMVVDEMGHEIFQSRREPDITIPVNGDSGFSNISYRHTKYLASYISSDVLPYKYVYMVKDTDYTRQMHTIGILFVSSYLLCFLIGAALSLRFARKNFMPIRTLAEKFEGNTTGAGAEVFETIERAVENLLEDKRQADKLIAIQRNTAKEEFLSRLARGRFSDNKDTIYEGFGKYHMEICAVALYMILFSIQEPGDFSKDGEMDEDDEKIIQFAISNVCQELMGDVFQLHFFQIDDYYACLTLDLSEAHGISFIRQQLGTLLSFFQSNFGVLLAVSLSQSADDYRMIPKLYAQAVEAMSYRLLIDEGNLLDYDQLMDNTQAYSYHTQDKSKLVNLLSSGNAEETTAFVRDIVRRNRHEKNINIHMMKMLLVEIAGTLLKVTVEADKEHLVNTMAFIEKLMQLMDFSKLEEVLAQMDAYIWELCGIINQNQQRTEVLRCNNIKQYVEEHCTNPNLAVSMIASEFGLSLSYLSNYFKEQTGIGIAEYIAQCRIRHAKHLLEETTLSIGEIGEKTGFFSTAVFIRTFKKFELTTPGQYRKIHGISNMKHKE